MKSKTKQNKKRKHNKNKQTKKLAHICLFCHLNYKGLPAVENYLQWVSVQMKSDVKKWREVKVLFLLFQSKLDIAI